MLSAVSRTSANSLLRLFATTKPLIDRINEVVKDRIKPVLQMDGGDIIINGVKDGVVDVTLLGQCSGCPSRKDTLHFGILGCLQEEIPDEIKDIKETIE